MVRQAQAKALAFIASGAAAAFIRFSLLFLRYSWSRRTSSACYFSAEGKVERIIMSKEFDLLFYNFNFPGHY
jgi:hypothetical protein